MCDPALLKAGLSTYSFIRLDVKSRRFLAGPSTTRQALNDTFNYNYINILGGAFETWRGLKATFNSNDFNRGWKAAPTYI